MEGNKIKAITEEITKQHSVEITKDNVNYQRIKVLLRTIRRLKSKIKLAENELNELIGIKK